MDNQVKLACIATLVAWYLRQKQLEIILACLRSTANNNNHLHE